MSDNQKSKFDHKAVETKYIAKWQKDKLYLTEKINEGDSKFYSLYSFPYPSGAGIHVGHAEGMVANDIMARFHRMKGSKTMLPMGWDSFGLPAENYAIKTGVHPNDSTEEAIATFIEQIKHLGIAVDWEKELGAHRPDYYKWTQWFFTQLYKHGLAYKAKAPVNWCPKDQTVLANEQVIDGKCERCDSEVEQKSMDQWFFKITDYADRLVDELDQVDWPDSTKHQQRNWISRSNGAEVKFKVINSDKKVLVATNNKSKIQRIRKLLNSSGIYLEILQPSDLMIESIEVNETSDVEENAKMKALAYAKKANMPVIGNDSALFIEGIGNDPAKVKRNALGDLDEKDLSQKEIAEKMTEYYKKIATDNGGSVNAYFLDVFAIVMPDGTTKISNGKRELKITNQQKGKLDIYFPINSHYKVLPLDKYFNDLNPEEEIEWLEPQRNALVEVMSEYVSDNKDDSNELKIFTTRPDTIFGATFMVIAPEHGLIQSEKSKINNYEEIEEYVRIAKNKTDLERTDLNKDKSGVEIKGICAINPVTGRSIPIFVADYVLAGYGTGAIMAVPAHDQRDYDFAKKHNISLVQVIAPEFGQKRENEEFRDGGCAVVFDPQSQKYAVARSKNNFYLFAGGPDEGEKISDTIVREVREESGLYDFKHVEKLTTAYAHYYHNLKKLNRFARVEGYLIILNSTNTQSQKLESYEDFELAWVSPEDLLKEWGKSNSEDESHYVYILKQAVNRAKELGYDTTSKIDSVQIGLYEGEGIIDGSGEFNGMYSNEAVEKITNWLEKRKLGKKSTTYRLRDWLISRQRYWGAPIPVIWKERRNPDKVLSIHGINSTGESNWLPWVKNKLEIQNEKCKIFNPDFPGGDDAALDQWLEIIGNQKLTENSSIVAHSMGCFAALKYAEEHKIKQLILVSPTNTGTEAYWKQQKNDFPNFPVDKVRKNFYFEELNSEKIAKNVEEIVLIFGNDDPYVNDVIRDQYEKQFGQFTNVETKILFGRHHLGAEVDCKEIPELLAYFADKQYRALDTKDLPMLLPHDVDFIPKGYSPLSRSKEYSDNVKKKFGQEWTPEFDTMDTFVCSSWYFFRYTDPKNTEMLAQSEELNKWLPVDLYMIGAEHIVLHLMYARFFTKFLYDIGLIKFTEPFYRMRHMGMILGPDGRKMSKRWGNIINPTDVVDQYGADTLRVYEMFMGPLDQSKAWDDSSVQGVKRFIERVYRMASDIDQTQVKDEKLSELEISKTIKEVSEDSEKLKFNTAVSEFMKFMNFADKNGVRRVDFEKFILLLAPYAPFLSEYIWCDLWGNNESVHKQKWPEFDKKILESQNITIAVQVMGKTRGTVSVSSNSSESDIIDIVKNDSSINKYLQNGYKKTIYVAGKIINFIV